MKNLLILGAGTAGTMMANHLRKKLPRDAWNITVVDQYPKHYYQPGFLFLPFGLYSEADVVKPKKKFIPRGVSYIESKVERIEAEANRVLLASGETLNYDVLVIATGAAAFFLSASALGIGEVHDIVAAVRRRLRR